MNWPGSVWAWVAQHPVTVVGVAAGLLAVSGLVFAVRALRARKREREAALRSRVETDEMPLLASWSGAQNYEPDPTLPSRAGKGLAARKLASAAQERGDTSVEIAAFASARSRHSDPSTPQGALEIEAGRLAYQVPDRMWLGVQETVEVHLGQLDAKGLTEGFAGRGDVRTEGISIVETMSVSLVCDPGAFDIVPRSEKVQLVKPNLVKGTPFHQADFGKWAWLVTPLQRGERTLLVKVSAALKDSRGVDTSASLPDKIIAVTVHVDLAQATVGALLRAAPAAAGAVATTLVGIFTKDYWWPYARDVIWPAVRAVAGLQ